MGKGKPRKGWTPEKQARADANVAAYKAMSAPKPPPSRPTKSERRAARKNPAPPVNPNLGKQFYPDLGVSGRDSLGRSTAYDMGNGFNNYGSGMHAGPHYH